MENERIYDDGDLVIFKRNSRFYLRYDAGAHQIAIREDEISEEEVKLIMKSEADATKVLFSIQRRIKEAGLNPYKSNIK